MATIKARGHEFEINLIKDSFTRSAVQFRNSIIHTLKKLGITENQIDIRLEPIAFKKAPASAEWYFNERLMYYSYENCDKFVDNLYVVFRVLELEVEMLISKQRLLEDFTSNFSEDSDVEEQRKEARKMLGLNEDIKDIHVINKRYKELAREHHPDTPTGNLIRFKEVNHAHKILKRELE